MRKKARALDLRELKSPVIQQLIDDMIETIIEYHGAGLEAPQVHSDLRLFIAITDADGDEAAKPIVLVNPEIVPVGAAMVEDWEGCLSIPEVRGKVPRAREITVRALDHMGDRIEFGARDFPARVIQHEYDHIEGILILDRIGRSNH